MTERQPSQSVIERLHQRETELLQVYGEQDWPAVLRHLESQLLDLSPYIDDALHEAMLKDVNAVRPALRKAHAVELELADKEESGFYKRECEELAEELHEALHTKVTSAVDSLREKGGPMVLRLSVIDGIPAIRVLQRMVSECRNIVAGLKVDRIMVGSLQ